MSVANEEQIVLRVPADTSERAEALMGPMAADPKREGLRLTRSGVLRIALLRGLQVLEGEYPAKGGKR